MEKEDKNKNSSPVNHLPIQVLLFLIIALIGVLINYFLNMRSLVLNRAIGEVTDGGLYSSIPEFVLFEVIIVVVFGICAFIVAKLINTTKRAHRFLIFELALSVILIISLIAAICVYSSDDMINKLVQQVKESKGVLQESTEKELYNDHIKPYLGEDITGSEVKSMLDEIIELNQSNIGKEGLFLGVKVEKGVVKNYTAETKLLQACEKASIYKSTDGYTIVPGDNNEKNVNAAKAQMIALKHSISNDEHFSVYINSDKGRYTWVYIDKSN